MHSLIYLLALISLSQASIIIRWSHTDPLLLGSWRLLFASLILRAFYDFTKSKKNLITKLSKKQWKEIILIGFLFFLHLYSYAYSAHAIPISHLMLIYSCNPAFTSIGNLLFFKEKVTPYHLISFFFSFLGIYLLVFTHDNNINLAQSSTPQTSWIGESTAILAAITFSAYSLFSKHIRKELPNSLLTSSFYLVASLFFFLTTFFTLNTPVPMDSKSWIAILLLAVFPTILGHSSYTYCMNYIDIQILSLGKLIEPIFSALSAHWLFNEPITSRHAISFALITFGISLIILKPKIKI